VLQHWEKVYALHMFNGEQSNDHLCTSWFSIQGIVAFIIHFVDMHKNIQLNRAEKKRNQFTVISVNDDGSEL
jgi:hypothetical protein